MKQDVILYHGSRQIVECPEIRITRFHKDFYYGFYCTMSREQAKRWAVRYNNVGVINEYMYNPDETLKILRFSEMTEEWLDFIVSCRLGKSHTYDIVEGPMAKFKRPTHQISFHTEKALSTLTFLKGCEVSGEE